MRRRRYAARVLIVCTGTPPHPRTTLATVLLDPVTRAGTVDGLHVQTGAAEPRPLGDVVAVRCDDPGCTRTRTVTAALVDTLIEAGFDDGRLGSELDIAASR